MKINIFDYTLTLLRLVHCLTRKMIKTGGQENKFNLKAESDLISDRSTIQKKKITRNQ